MGEGWWPSPREVPGQDTRHPPTLSSHQGAEGPESEEGRLAAAVLETGTLPSSPPQQSRESLDTRGSSGNCPLPARHKGQHSLAAAPAHSLFQVLGGPLSSDTQALDPGLSFVGPLSQIRLLESPPLPLSTAVEEAGTGQSENRSIQAPVSREAGIPPAGSGLVMTGSRCTLGSQLPTDPCRCNLSSTPPLSGPQFP